MNKAFSLKRKHIIVLIIFSVLILTVAFNSIYKMGKQSIDKDILLVYAEKLDLNSDNFTFCMKSGKYLENITTDYDLAVHLGISGTPGFVVNSRMFSGAYPYENFSEFLSFEYVNSSDYEYALTLISDKDEILGNIESAPIIMVEFSDYACPACRIYHMQTFPKIKEEWIKPGKVAYVFKDFPLTSIHPNAMRAAHATRCAQEQGKYWEYADMLYENQQEWAK